MMTVPPSSAPKLETDDGEHGNQRVLQTVAQHDDATTQALWRAVRM